LYDLLKPHVIKLVVCDPRKNKSMREGNQSDKIDARRLAELLRLDHLTPVYHGEHGLRTLKELVRSYLTVTKDLARVMTRVKAIYRSWAIPCTGKQVYAPRHRAAVLLGILQTPHRFRTKRQLWNFGGLAIEMHSSADHRSVDGHLQRSRKNVLVGGLNRNCNHDLKNLFKGVRPSWLRASRAPFRSGVFS